MSDYISDELILNILTRLPVDDVIRCTSVCKSWYLLICSSSFASLHLNISSPNKEPRLLIRSFNENLRVYNYCLYRDNQTIDEIAELDHSYERNWVIIDCLNGLICLHDKTEGMIVLWNPSLRKSHILPKSRVLSEYSVGFGFVAASNEYKIVRSSCKNKPQAEIYELSIGSWRSLKLGKNSFGSGRIPQAHLNGILHWYWVNSEKVKPTFSHIMYSFDMKTEKFGTFSVPNCVSHDEDAFLIPFTSKESLYLLDFVARGNYIKIWVMQKYGVSDSWENVLVIHKEQYEIPHVPYLRHNGDLLISITRFSSGGKTFSYGLNNDTVESVIVLANSPQKSTCLQTLRAWTYVDSLVLINCSMKSRLMKNRVTRSGLLLN